MNITSLTDKELFELCREYGTKALVWRKKFIGLLPEVNRRKLYERKGCTSIFEFAAKLCGLSEEHVRLALNLEKRFEDKPTLKALLVNGEVSVSKLAKVASIATPDNEEALAAQLKVLPRSAIETLVRDEKYNKNVPGNSNPQQLFKNANVQNYLQNSIGDTGDSTSSDTGLHLSDEVTTKLLELQEKGIDVNNLILEFLNKREEKIAEKKEEIAATLFENRSVGCAADPVLRDCAAVAKTVSRYIPIQIKKILREEYGEKCSINTCKKPAATIHHTQRFSLSQNHDPRFLAPLCLDHHIIAHSIDLKYHRARALAI